MLLPLILLLTTIPALELMVILSFHGFLVSLYHEQIALIFTISSILSTGFIGAYLTRRQGMEILRRLREAFSQGTVPSGALVDGLLVIVGGLLLVTPGYLTDLIGISLILPQTQGFYRRWIQQKIRRKMADGSVTFHTYTGFAETDAPHSQPPKVIRRRRRWQGKQQENKPADVIDISQYQDLRKGR